MTRPPALVSVAILAAALALAGAACSGETSSTSTATPSTAATPNAAETTPSGQVSHAAPGLEALLPGMVGRTRLQKGSATGTGIFGGDAFSMEMTRILAAAGRKSADFVFANAQDPQGTLELEVGVFEVKGMSAAALRRAIVASSRPNAPGLTVSRTTLAGKPVTMLVYPGGSVLYLYERKGWVFYVGTQSDALAGAALGLLP